MLSSTPAVPCCHPSGKWAYGLAYGPPKRMKMIGGPFKPFFGLSGVHFQVPGNHFRPNELGFAEGVKSLPFAAPATGRVSAARGVNPEPCGALQPIAARLAFCEQRSQP